MCDIICWDGHGTGSFVLGRERNGNVCLGTGTERERLSWDGNGTGTFVLGRERSLGTGMGLQARQFKSAWRKAELDKILTRTAVELQAVRSQ
jgi:hypothetical protein